MLRYQRDQSLTASLCFVLSLALAYFVLALSLLAIDYISYRQLTVTGVVNDTAVRQIGSSVAYHKLSWNVSGTVSACSVKIDTSADAVTWTPGGAVAAQTCTSNGLSTVAGPTVANYVRISVTSFTGTGSVVVAYSGYVNNPTPTGGTVTAVTGTPPLSFTAGNAPNGTCAVATGSVAGCLAAADFTTFSAKQAGPLTGDVTTSGAAATVVKVNGVAFPASPSLHASPTVTATNTVTYKVLPSCTDTAGNHLNYDQSTDTYSCGTSTAGGGTAAFAGPYPLENGFPDATGNVFYSSVALTSPFVHAHWEFDKANTVKDLSFRFRYPHTIPSGAAKVVLGNISANDGTAGHTMTFKECDKVVSTIENPASYTCTATQTFTTTSTAYAPADLTFTLNDTPVADKEVQIYIECTATSGLTNNVLLGGVYMEWQ